MLVLIICAQDYNTTDGDPMPGCLHKSVVMPRQVLSESEEKNLKMIADGLFVAVMTTGVIAFTLSVVLGASLSLLWGLINAQ